MYPYHNKIKQRIKNDELTSFEFVEKYKAISPCLVLFFRTEPFVKPIRQHRFEEYAELLGFEVPEIYQLNEKADSI